LKRLSTAVLTVLVAAGLGLNAVAAPPGHAAQANLGPNVLAQATPAPPPAANFGAPPSGQIPILFNDRHVYAKPDKLKQGRVLAALVRGGTILIPLRSMFEQMGATVSYDAGSRTVDVSKAGSDVKVTVGKAEVVINGETRPLDVPPEIYQGHVVVPVRVISEGMGAYVLWVADRHLVVVRYVAVVPTPATPEPTPAPTLAPTPTPAPVKVPYLDKFIVGDFIFSPKVYNEFSPGNSGNTGSSYNVRGAVEFPLAGLPWMLEGDYRQFQYPHNADSTTAIRNSPCDGFGLDAVNGDPGCVTVMGGMANVFTPAFTARENDFDGRLGLRIASPRIYIGVGYMYRSVNYGYPRQTGFGFGAEKLPDLDQAFSVYGSVWYYPSVSGNCGIDVCPTGPFTLSYRIWKYQIGGTFNFGQSPIFLDFGFLGDRGTNRINAPSDYTHNGGYLGLGLHF
jgi:hypothetical protein